MMLMIMMNKLFDRFYSVFFSNKPTVSNDVKENPKQSSSSSTRTTIIITTSLSLVKRSYEGIKLFLIVCSNIERIVTKKIVGWLEHSKKKKILTQSFYSLILDFKSIKKIQRNKCAIFFSSLKIDFVLL